MYDMQNIKNTTKIFLYISNKFGYLLKTQKQKQNKFWFLALSF